MNNSCIKENHKLEQVVRQYVSTPEHWHTGMRLEESKMAILGIFLPLPIRIQQPWYVGNITWSWFRERGEHKSSSPYPHTATIECQQYHCEAREGL